MCYLHKSILNTRKQVLFLLYFNTRRASLTYSLRVLLKILKITKNLARRSLYVNWRLIFNLTNPSRSNLLIWQILKVLTRWCWSFVTSTLIGIWSWRTCLDVGSESGRRLQEGLRQKRISVEETPERKPWRSFSGFRGRCFVAGIHSEKKIRFQSNVITYLLLSLLWSL